MEIEIDGARVWYEVLGDGRPLVCLHGWPADHEHIRHDLEPVFESRPGWRRIYVDLPGLGRSPATEQIVSHEDMARFVARLVTQLVRDGRFCIAGASYGGYLAQWLAHQCPGRIEGFFIYVPSFGSSNDRRVPAPTVIDPNPQLLANLAEDEQLWASAQTVHSPESLENFRAVIKPAIDRADGDFVSRMNDTPMPPAPAPLPPLSVPALIVTGRQDSWCGYAQAWELVEGYPRATFAVLDRAAHGISDDRPELFHALISDWLERVEAETRGAIDSQSAPTNTAA
jgi:pimeloyl-ACP methyl ester carboxylesterase